MTAVRALVIEDDPLDARTLHDLLVQAGEPLPLEVHRAPDLAGGCAALRAGSFDVVLLDLDLPDGCRAAAVEQVRSLAGGAPLVVLADRSDQGMAPEALAGGAEELLVHGRLAAAALACVVRGAAERRARRPDELRPRQREILALVARGYSNDEIAAQLFISVNTVKFHLRTAYRTLGVHNRMQAVQLLGLAPADG